MWMGLPGRGRVGLQDPAQWVVIILPASSMKVCVWGSTIRGAGEIPSVDMDSLLQCPAELHSKEGVNINNCFLFKHSLLPVQSSSLFVSASSSGNYLKNSPSCCR